MTMVYLALSGAVGICCLCSIFFFDVNQYQLPLIIYFELIPGSSVNWLLNYVYQVYVTVFTTIFYYSFFALTLNIMNHACWEADVTILLIKQFGRILDDDDDHDTAKILRKALIAEKLERIIDMTYQLINFHGQVQSFMEFVFLVDFTMFSFDLCMCMFTIKTSTFSALLLPMVLAQIFVYCWMGNRVIVRYEDLTTSLYGVKWYLMDGRYQKDLQLILLRAQGLEGFNGIFKTVSLDTFQKVC